MIAIVCVDDRMGMLFNHRRQSKDRLLLERVLAIVQDAPLWMNAYSAKLFEPSDSIHVAEDFLHQAKAGEYCFVETEHLANLPVESLILYRWNRRYPGDFFLDLPLDNYTLLQTQDFAGTSHETITEEIYTL